MAPISSTRRPLSGRDPDSGCEGWSCYSSSQQIGLIFMAIVVPVVVGLVFWFVLIKPNISYWKRVSREAKQRQEMEQQVRADALRQIPVSSPPACPPPEPPREQKPQEQPHQTQDYHAPPDAPPCKPSSPAESQQTPVGSPLKLPPASEAPKDSSPVAEDDAPFVNSPKSIQSQPPKTGSAEEAPSPAAKVQPSGQKTQAETGFQWAEHIPGMQRPHQSAEAPMMPFPPLQQYQNQQRQYLPGLALRQPFPQPSFYPFISVLPPPPPPLNFTAAGQQMPGSFPVQQNRPVYHAPSQPTYAPSPRMALNKEQQSQTSVSFTTKSTSFPELRFSKPRKTALPPRSLTESDLGPDRMPSENRGKMAGSPMALPSETSSGNSHRRDDRDTEAQREGRHCHVDTRDRGRRHARSAPSFESQYSRNGHGHRYSSSRHRHGAKHSPRPTHKHERRRARRESSRSCSPDYHRLQKRPKGTKRSRFAFLAPLIPIALGALGIATEARAHEQRKRLREAEEFSIRHQSLERGPVGRRSDNRVQDKRRRSMSRGLLNEAIRVFDEHATDSALGINRTTTQHQPTKPPRIRYNDLQYLRGGGMIPDTRSEDGRGKGQGKQSSEKGGREKGKTREEDRSSNSSSAVSSTYWRFRDSDSLRRHGGSDSSLA